MSARRSRNRGDAALIGLLRAALDHDPADLNACERARDEVRRIAARAVIGKPGREIQTLVSQLAWVAAVLGHRAGPEHVSSVLADLEGLYT